MKKFYFMIIAAAVCWGVIPIFYNGLSQSGLSSMQTITMRFSLAAVGYVVYLLLRDRSLLRIKRPVHLLYFVGTGVCSVAFFNFCYITCIQSAGVAVAALLLYTAPAFVLIMSAVLFGERLTARGLIALGMTVTGCAFVAGAFAGGLTMSPAALLWGLGSGFGYALYSVFGKYALRHYRPETITAYTAVFAALATLPLARPGELVGFLHSGTVWFHAIGCALVCTVMAYLLYTGGLAKIPAGQASILSTTEPVVATVLGVALLGESMSLHKLCGILLVLGAIIVLGAKPKSEGQTVRDAVGGQSTP